MALETAGRSGRIRHLRHHSALGQWEMATCRPDPRLVAWVNEYQGYTETAAAGTIGRREVPWPGVVLVINFGPPFRLTDPRIGSGPADFPSFVAGVYDSWVVAESTGLSSCMQVNFTPIGASLFFGVPMAELANRAVPLEDLLGPAAPRLSEQLQEAPDWAARFALLDTLLLGRIERAVAPPAKLIWAWQQLQHSGDHRRIGALARELGWSPKHLSARFHRHIGLPPKVMARLIRFQRVVRWLEGQVEVHWGRVAHQAGYYDQAHLNREFRQLAGSAPGDFLRSRLETSGSIQET